MDESLRFVARRLEGEKMSPLCREFGISRVTGYKFFERYKERYKECGLDGLNDRSRRPYRQANKLPFQIERCILGLKREHPTWGAPKLRDKLVRQYPMVKALAISTVHAVLDRHGLVQRRKRRRYKARGTELQDAQEVNGLWRADYKGEFKLGNRHYCYPLTVTDYRSRKLRAAQAILASASSSFQRCYGSSYISDDLPEYLAGKGMTHTRGAPYHPQTQGKSERWHQTLKNRILLDNYFLPQDLEAQIDAFIGYYNHRRYHESLENLTPANVYTGRGQTLLLERERIKKRTMKQRRLQHDKSAA